MNSNNKLEILNFALMYAPALALFLYIVWNAGRDFLAARRFTSRQTLLRGRASDFPEEFLESRAYNMELLRSTKNLPLDAPRRRSLDLLYASLQPEEVAFFEKNLYLRARGSRSGKVYHIYPRSLMNIYHGADIYCAAAVEATGESVLGKVPIFDSVLAQKTLIEIDERKFLRIANKI